MEKRAVIGLVTAAIACSSAQQPGQTPQAGAESAPTAENSTSEPSALWPHFTALHRWPRVGEPFVTEHVLHHGRARVRVSPDAHQVYVQLVPGVALPPGSIVVEELLSGSSEELAGVLVMEKGTDGSWAYRTLDRTGHSAGQGSSELCRRCHQEGVSDELFGPSSLLHTP